MKDIAFFHNDLRSWFTDECYGVIGRALTFATRYEINCRGLASFLNLREASSLLDSDKMFQKLTEVANKLFKRRLKQQITSLSQYYEFPLDVIEILEKGREARNAIVHEITVGIEHHINNDEGKEKIIKDVETEVRRIAEADCLVCFLLHLENKDLTAPKIEDYCNMVANWVCEVEKNP